MKTAIQTFALTAVVTMLAACQQEKTAAPSEDSAPASPDPIASEQVHGDGMTVSGPYSHRNLDVYLIHGDDRAGFPILTLDEAMAKGAVVVHETGNVNELKIENKSGEAHIFVHSGDILKGGKQDRTLPNSLVLAPGSKPTPVASFCVEQSRWQQRAGEAVDKFSSSVKQLNSKDLKIAARLKKDQGEVWKKVNESQTKLSKNVYKGDGRQVNSGLSVTSLQLALENKDLAAEIKRYTEAVNKAIGGQDDVVGYAYAVNGEFNSGDIYLTRELFGKLWPRRLEAAASEALGEADAAESYQRLKASSILAALGQADEAQAQTEELAGRNHVVVREAEKAVRFDACYQPDDKKLVVHENVIAK